MFDSPFCFTSYITVATTCSTRILSLVTGMFPFEVRTNRQVACYSFVTSAPFAVSVLNVKFLSEALFETCPGCFSKIQLRVVKGENWEKCFRNLNIPGPWKTSSEKTTTVLRRVTLCLVEIRRFPRNMPHLKGRSIERR